MSSEIKVSYTKNQTPLTADAYKPDGTEREFGIALTEAARDGLYLGDCATIVNGDLVVAYHDSVYIGGERYDDGLDEAVEGTITLRQAIRLFLSVLTGKSSGGGTSALKFRDIADSKDRLAITVDRNGNRLNVTTRDGS